MRKENERDIKRKGGGQGERNGEDYVAKREKRDREEEKRIRERKRRRRLIMKRREVRGDRFMSEEVDLLNIGGERGGQSGKGIEGGGGRGKGTEMVRW